MENRAIIHILANVLTFREGGYYVAYCQAIDLSSTGKTTAEAVRNLCEAFGLYAEYTLENGTLLDDLEGHGWKVGDVV